MTKPKIVFLSRYQGRINRGAERVVAVLADKLASDFEVEILSGPAADDWQRVRAGGYDVVIPVNGRWQALKMSWWRVFGGYRVMIIGHSGLGRDDYWNLAIARPNLFVVLTKATLANWRMKFIHKLAFGVKIKHIPNGVDTSVFTVRGVKTVFDLPKPIVLSVGALEPSKRHDLVIKAMSELEQGSLVIVGQGSQKSALEQLAKQKIPGRFMITRAEFEDLPAIYRGANLFTLPSWSREAFGLVYLEAMATNLPVVAPDDALRREIIGSAGKLVDVTDSQKYAQAIEQVLAQDWGNLPRQQAEQFDWDVIAQRYIQEIKKLCR